MLTETRRNDSMLAGELRDTNVAITDVTRAGKSFYELAKIHLPVNETSALALLRLEDSIMSVVQLMREESLEKLNRIKKMMGNG